MLQDLHSHTFYSFCGGDEPEAVVEAAIAGGLDMIGITDHNYGIGYVNRALFKIASEVEAVDYEQALRRYQGRAVYEGGLSDEELLPLVKKYGLII